MPTHRKTQPGNPLCTSVVQVPARNHAERDGRRYWRYVVEVYAIRRVYARAVTPRSKVKYLPGLVLDNPTSDTVSRTYIPCSRHSPHNATGYMPRSCTTVDDHETDASMLFMQTLYLCGRYVGLPDDVCSIILPTDPTTLRPTRELLRYRT